MMPMVPMKSSTGMPFRAWIFLKTSSDNCCFDCAEAMPTHPASATAPTTNMCFIRACHCIGLVGTKRNHGVHLGCAAGGNERRDNGCQESDGSGCQEGDRVVYVHAVEQALEKTAESP